MWELYQKLPSFVLGFHGCDESVGEAVLAGSQSLKRSENDYDWLGHGIYFWECNPQRASDFATQINKMSRPRTTGTIRSPFVLGAIIDLGHCCNLFDARSSEEIAGAHRDLLRLLNKTNTPFPKNEGGPDKLRRKLDCAVIEAMHGFRKEAGLPEYESVRASFEEGDLLYEGSGFTEKAHIQIAVRNVQCIRGFFRPIASSELAPAVRRVKR